MARSELIHNYLAELQIYLSRVSEVQAQEVVQEIESHIYDTLAMQPGAERLGRRSYSGSTWHSTRTGCWLHRPHHYRRCTTQRTKTTVPGKKGISSSLYYLICILGYGSGAALVLVALTQVNAAIKFRSLGCRAWQ